MKFRFTTRDLLWLMVVVAIACGWWLESRRSPTRQLQFRAEALQAAIEDHGFTVEYPAPFTVNVGHGSAEAEVSGGPHSLNPDLP